MTFDELYHRLLNVLAERETPEYWTETELKTYLNEGLVEFCRRTKFLRKHVYLDRSDIDVSAYFLPVDILEPISVQYRGKPLDRKSIKFLETQYAGTAHQEILAGQAKEFVKDWRELTGEPIHWYFENQFVRLFPIPQDSAINSNTTLIQRFTATLYEGNNQIQLPFELPNINRATMNLFIGGIYQNQNTWDIDPNNRRIIRLPYTADFTAPVEVTFPNQNAVIMTKMSQLVEAGQYNVYFDTTIYDPAVDGIEAYLNGVKLTPGNDYLVTREQTRIKIYLIYPPSSNGILEINIYSLRLPENAGNRVTDSNVTMDYLRLPTQMTSGGGEPEIPRAFHDACWQWAAFLALSKEGKKTQDIQKGQIYRMLFEQTIAGALKFSDDEIDVNQSLFIPFKV